MAEWSIERAEDEWDAFLRAVDHFQDDTKMIEKDENDIEKIWNNLVCKENV